ncbi:hypothetical protein BGW42_007297, partial [Actinomortierella wolfii]
MTLARPHHTDNRLIEESYFRRDIPLGSLDEPPMILSLSENAGYPKAITHWAAKNA